MVKPELLWSPTEEQINSSRMRAFADYAEKFTGRTFSDFETLHKWSCETGGEFWNLLWDFCDVRGPKGDRIVENEGQMPGAVYFPDAELNYAENLLGDADYAAGSFSVADIAMSSWLRGAELAGFALDAEQPTIGLRTCRDSLFRASQADS